MQFIPEGPDIPEHLLNAHADGDVVFFCGAGVSVDAGYPLFGKLVNQLRDQNPISDTPELNDAISSRNYDFALSILEKQIGTGGMLRTGVRDILSEPPRTLRVHEILLDLVAQGHGSRLVTTNFDRLFIQADKAGSFVVDAAPRLPIPKKKRWNSIVVSASPIAYGFGLDVFRNRQGMSSPIWLCGWPLMMASRVSAR